MKHQFQQFSTIWAALTVWCVACSTMRGDPVTYNTASAYHWQQTPFYCAIASVEMQLDEPSVTGTNANVNATMAAVNAANAGTSLVLENGTPVTVLNGDYALQNSLYGTVYGPVSALAFANHRGITAAAQAGLMNLTDGPINGGIHGYAWYSAPTFNAANRTLAAAIALTGVSASASVLHGAHAINVYGVQTTGAVGANTGYTINGFFIHDPWTGLYLTNPAATGNIVGFGVNTYMRVGADQAGGLPLQTLNWGAVFNAVPALRGYVSEVEPTGPVSLDPGTINSIPPPPPELATLLNASGAEADALTDLSANATLASEPGLDDGGFDTHTADDLFLQAPDAATGQGDWVIPYDGTGGTNDVTGALLIDAGTGVVDQATWFDSTDPVSSMSLAQLDLMFLDEQDGNEPVDNVTPEPASLLLWGVGVVALAMLGKRRAIDRGRGRQGS